MARVLIPDAMTTAKLISSSIPEPAATGEAPYDPGEIYSIGATVSVISGDLHHKFKSLQNNNQGNTPVPRPGESAFWLHIGNTIRWNPFDLEANYKAVGTSPITYVIAPGKKIDFVAIGGASADFAQLITKNSLAAELFNNTQDIRLRDVDDYYDYFFADYYERHIIMWDNLPSTRDGTFELTITGGSEISLEWLAWGESVYLGDEEFNATDDVLNFSTVDRRTTGEIILVPKISAFKPQITTFVNPKYLRTIRQARTVLNAKPAIWNMYENQSLYYHPNYLIKGIYKGFAIVSENHKEARIDFDLEGV